MGRHLPAEVEKRSIEDVPQQDYGLMQGIAPDRNAEIVCAKGEHTGCSGSTRRIPLSEEEAGIESLKVVLGCILKFSFIRTATSIVLSCPTNEMSEFHPSRSITAATNTGPFMALEAATNAPSGDQL